MDFQTLADELTNDPLGRGYAGMDSTAAANSLNTADRNRNRDSMTGREVMDAFTGNESEWDALSAANQDRIISLCGRGGEGNDLNPWGIDADIFLNAAAGSTNTISALQAARVETVSRATELGLPNILPGHVEFART